jgi:hypothetical protein
MPDDLHQRDILEWSERQADLLRHVAGDEAHANVDWSHVIEEITGVGVARLNEARGYLRQVMIYLVGIHRDRDGARPLLKPELECLLEMLAQLISPSMRRRIDLELMWSGIRAGSRRKCHDDPLRRALPEHCPWTVDALLANDVEKMLASLAGWPVVSDTV